MTPEAKRLLFPLRAPRALTQLWQPVHSFCAAVSGYLEGLKAVYRDFPLPNPGRRHD